MSDPSAESRLLRGFLEVILNSNLTAAEALSAAQALRSGQLVEPIAHVLEAFGAVTAPLKSTKPVSAGVPAAPALQNDKKPNNRASPDQADELFELIKRRKINKNQLYSMLQEVNADAAPGPDDDLSIRESLRVFSSLASDDDIKLFTAVAEGRSDIDPFLRGILNR